MLVEAACSWLVNVMISKEPLDDRRRRRRIDILLPALQQSENGEHCCLAVGHLLPWWPIEGRNV